MASRNTPHSVLRGFIVRSFCNGDGNESVKKAIGAWVYLSRTTTLRVHHFFFRTFLCRHWTTTQRRENALLHVLRRTYCKATTNHYFLVLVSVVEKVESAIHWINLYLVGKAIFTHNTYSLASELSGG